LPGVALVRTGDVSAVDHLEVADLGPAGPDRDEPADALEHSHRGRVVGRDGSQPTNVGSSSARSIGADSADAQ
jgi:hypothetical protein